MSEPDGGARYLGFLYPLIPALFLWLTFFHYALSLQVHGRISSDLHSATVQIRDAMESDPAHSEALSRGLAVVQRVRDMNSEFMRKFGVFRFLGLVTFLTGVASVGMRPSGLRYLCVPTGVLGLYLAMGHV